MRRGVLFLSYTGLLEPLGQSQVLAYQERLSEANPVHIVSFERPEDMADASRIEALRARVARAGIHWHPLRYHKRFSVLATLWDIAVGTWIGWRLVREHGLGIVHARSYVPGVMALVIKRLTGVRFLFDMRGFWVDERIDGGMWPPGGVLFRAGKWIERKLLLGADHVVSLTHAAMREIRGFGYLQGRMPSMTVIPTCADLSRFNWTNRHIEEPFTLGYVGSAGTWYLFDAAVGAFSMVLAKVPDARFLIVNRGAHAYIRERLAAGGVPIESVELREAPHSEVPELMSRVHAGVFFYKPSYSRAACSPTKLGEFLGCGIPCLSNTGVGDMAEILRQDRVGVALDAMDVARLQAGVAELLALTEELGVHERCVESARRHFSLDVGAGRYRAIYDALGSDSQ